MSTDTSLPEPLPVRIYVEEGVRIVAILFVWVLAGIAFAIALIPALSLAGIDAAPIWPLLLWPFALTGVLNAVLYVVYRTIAYWRAEPPSG